MQTNETNEHRKDFYSISLWLEYILSIYCYFAVHFTAFYQIKAHIQIGDSNSTHTRASAREVLLEECLTEQCSSFKLVFKHVSQPLLTGVDSQASSTMERMSY